jgi:GntR family transcriptional regulator
VSIDHLGLTPVYLQLAQILRDRIGSGELAVGRPIPSLPQLMQQYEISRGTASRAVAVLVSEGMVQTVPGRGAFVIAKRPAK